MTKLMKCLLLIGACCLAHVKFALAGHVCDDKKLHTNNVNCGADEDETLVSSSGCGAFWNSACYDCCKKHGLTYDYYVGSWGSCSATCGGGTQTRTVQCQSGTSSSTAAADGACAGKTKPSTSQSCNTQECYTYSYTTGSWSSCSASCGGGTSTRSVTCKRSDGQSVSDSSCSGSKPSTSQSCNTGACATTTTTTTITFNEDGCDNKKLHTNNVNCGADEEETLVSSSGCGAFWASACYDCCKKQEAGEATPTPAPTTTTEAQTTSAITTNPAKAPTTSPTTGSYTYAFSEGSFGSCSETCGGGTRTRSVTCLRSDGQAVADTMCTSTKPSTSQSCNSQPCTTATTTPVVAATLQLPAKTSQAWQGTLLGALCAVAALVVVG